MQITLNDLFQTPVPAKLLADSFPSWWAPKVVTVVNGEDVHSAVRFELNPDANLLRGPYDRIRGYAIQKGLDSLDIAYTVEGE